MLGSCNETTAAVVDDGEGGEDCRTPYRAEAVADQNRSWHDAGILVHQCRCPEVGVGLLQDCSDACDHQ